MIHLRTLGLLDLRAADGHEIRSVLVRPKRLAVLVYLALAAPRGFHRRDRLLALFWPELDGSRGRNALSQALHVLRRGLGEGVLVNRGDEEVGIAEGVLECDAASFEAALERGELAEALELYRGDLLESFFADEVAPEFEQWLERERSRLRQRALDAVVELSATEKTRENLLAALQWSRRAVALAPHNESVVQSHLMLLGAQGDRTGAIRMYEEFAARLADEVGIEPSTGLQEYIQAIRASPGPEQIGSAATRSEVAAPILRVEASAGLLTPPPPPGWNGWRRLSAVVGLAGLVLIGGAYFGGRAEPVVLSDRRVVVAPFENQTGHPDFDPIGNMAADWITQGLSQPGLAEVVPPAAALTSLRYVDSVAVPTGRDRLRALAEETGAAFVVSGAFYRSGDSLQFRSEITDARSGRLLRMLEPVSGSMTVPGPAVEQLRQRTLAAVAPLLDPRLAEYAQAAKPPPSYEAYLDYARGLEHFIRVDFGGSAVYFERAYARDSSYTLALVFAATAYNTSGQNAMADSLVRILDRRRGSLTPYELAMLDLLRGMMHGPESAVFEGAQRVGRLAPGTVLHIFSACSARSMNRPREALRILDGIDLGRGEARGHVWPEVCRSTSHHILGDHHRELKVAREARRISPDEPYPLVIEGVALAALGRAPEVERVVDDLLLRAGGDAGLVGWTIVWIATELRAHGHPSESRALHERAVEWFEERSDRGRYCYYGGPVSALYGAERWEEARILATELAAANPDDIHCQGHLGVLAARRGDVAEAERASAWLAAQTQPYMRGDHTYWRARIAARLNRRSEAVELLRQAYAQGAPMHWHGRYHADPDLEPLLGYVPFQQFMRVEQ